MAALCEEDLDIHDPVEVHWSTSTILAVFFAASLISAVFFGLGYSFGGDGVSKRSVATHPVPASSNSTGLAALQAPPNHTAEFSQPAVIANAAESMKAPAAKNVQATPPAALRTVAVTSPAPSSAPILVKKVAPASPSVHQHATMRANSSARIMVQVGAIGDRKDAQRLVAELRKKGFRAGIYLAKGDKFLHVQIGPFPDAQQAQSERHRVMASGFRAILKNVS